eukprot:scaffold3066_cov178-Amphora_coffeaeformis.AAC.6
MLLPLTDTMGGFDGSTFGPGGAKQDTSILCDAPGASACPPGGPSKFEDKNGDTLYPIDSEFGFVVHDFVGATQKTRDRIYQDGFVGNIEEQGEIVGLKVSNAATDTYKVKPPLGTWCQGLGNTAVKCSTEHYTVMEHVLTCYETVPYFFAESSDGQDNDCEELDNELFWIDQDSNQVPFSDINALDPNDNTNLVDIAYSNDYSITKKDDGKILYRWGSLIKRPTDIRLYAKLELPAAWKEDDADFTVTEAKLVIDHWVTNNPNDQLRAEDLENEGATGRKPDCRILDDGSWESPKDCFEGDGDYIGVEEGTGDPTPIGEGTLLKRADDGTFNLEGTNPPEDWSEDLQEFYTNAWYTTLDRDPFEWSYKTDTEENLFEYEGYSLPLTPLEMEEKNLKLESGPRWRLKANKFGQDIPGLEIPRKNCEPPPYTKDKIKYNIGERTTTVINLLDWDEEEGPSPLATSKG